MVLVDSDDEEERKLLLSDSVTASPVQPRPGTDIGHVTGLDTCGPGRHVCPVPRLAWTSSDVSMSDNDKLRLGAAEEQFLAMAVGEAEEGVQGDQGDQVKNCLQVVSNILSDLDTDITDSKHTLHKSHARDGTPGSCDGCTCQLPHHKLVVDVHQGGAEGGQVARCDQVQTRCSKHTTDRIQARCHSESDRHLQRNDQLDNPDRIETVGEDTRCRHMSESAVGPLHWSLGRRKRAATLCTSPRNTPDSRTHVQQRHSGTGPLGASNAENDQTLDLVKHFRSTDSVRGESVKFDIWEEADYELGEEDAPESCDDKVQDSFDGIADKDFQEKSEFDCNNSYTQHPLVTELYNCYSTTCTTTGMSHSSSTSSMPICRICQLPSIEPHNTLISPCRCLGSIRYVHNPCLAKWLEVCSRKTGEAPVCELCQYQYIRHKKFVISNWRVPSISSKDKVLHSVFLMSIVIMIICSIATILSFKQADTLPKVGPDTELSSSELLTLSCGVLFFFSFFVAMYVEVKAEYTIYQLICKFFQMNHEWTILEYDRTRDRIKKDSSSKGSFP